MRLLVVELLVLVVAGLAARGSEAHSLEKRLERGRVDEEKRKKNVQASYHRSKARKQDRGVDASKNTAVLPPCQGGCARSIDQELAPRRAWTLWSELLLPTTTCMPTQIVDGLLNEQETVGASLRGKCMILLGDSTMLETATVSLENPSAKAAVLTQ